MPVWTATGAPHRGRVADTWGVGFGPVWMTPPDMMVTSLERLVGVAASSTRTGPGSSTFQLEEVDAMGMMTMHQSHPGPPSKDLATGQWRSFPFGHPFPSSWPKEFLAATLDKKWTPEHAMVGLDRGASWSSPFKGRGWTVEHCNGPMRMHCITPHGQAGCFHFVLHYILMFSLFADFSCA